MTKRSFFLAGTAALAAGVGYFRLAPMDPSDWHVDPADGQRTGKPNDYLIGPGGDQEALYLAEAPNAVMARLDSTALAEPRTERIAGSVEEGWATYVQRSALMGYPDAISVKVVAQGEGAQLTLWSRSRFGQSDLGVNRARVARWLEAAELGEVA